MMESVPSGSEEFSDLSRITLTEKYDSEWSIRINVFLDSAKPESQCGKIR